MPPSLPARAKVDVSRLAIGYPEFHRVANIDAVPSEPEAVLARRKDHLKHIPRRVRRTHDDSRCAVALCGDAYVVRGTGRRRFAIGEHEASVNERMRLAVRSGVGIRDGQFRRPERRRIAAPSDRYTAGERDQYWSGHLSADEVPFAVHERVHHVRRALEERVHTV